MPDAQANIGRVYARTNTQENLTVMSNDEDFEISSKLIDTSG